MMGSLMKSVDLTNKIGTLRGQPDQEKETGQSALMLSESVHETILFIRKQLSFA